MSNHGILAHSHRTFGGEHLFMVLVAVVIVILLHMNHWSISRRYVVKDVNNRTASRHYSPYAAYKAKQVMNDYNSGMYHIEAR